MIRRGILLSCKDGTIEKKIVDRGEGLVADLDGFDDYRFLYVGSR
jgi:hypothetical protein